MQRHRRSSLGGGGALPFGGHSFLLTAYSDEKQKERICHKITQLGGHLLEDVPKPQVLALFHPGSQPDCTSAVLVCVKHNRSVKDRVWFCCGLLQQEHQSSSCCTYRASGTVLAWRLLPCMLCLCILQLIAHGICFVACKLQVSAPG